MRKYIKKEYQEPRSLSPSVDQVSDHILPDLGGQQELWKHFLMPNNVVPDTCGLRESQSQNSCNDCLSSQKHEREWFPVLPQTINTQCVDSSNSAQGTAESSHRASQGCRVHLCAVDIHNGECHACTSFSQGHKYNLKLGNFSVGYQKASCQTADSRQGLCESQ